MADKPTLIDFAGSARLDVTKLNANNTTIEDAIENGLGRGGTSESNNSMTGVLDMDLNKIQNLGKPTADNDAIRLVDLSDSDATGAASAQLKLDLISEADTLGVDLVGNATRRVDTYTELQSITSQSENDQIILGGRSSVGDGCGGLFYWAIGDQSALVTLDPLFGTYIPPTTDLSGASGVWVRFSYLPTDGTKFTIGEGANIARQYDRIFVGGAAKNEGTGVAAQPDWLTTYQIASGRVGGFIQLASQAVLNADGEINVNTFVAAAQTKNIILDGLNAIGMIGVGVNNNTLENVFAYGGYYETYRGATSLGGAYGIEIDTVNYADVIQVDPYQQLPGQTIGLQLAAGAGLLSGAGQSACTAAINIQKNDSTFERGIVFGSDSLTGASGTAGTAPALVLGNGHQILWYGGTGIATSGIWCTGTTAAGSTSQIFSNSTVNWTNGVSGKNIFQLIGDDTTVNSVQIQALPTGYAPRVSAVGDDTNIDLSLLAKGTGVVSFGAYTADVVAQAGYITIKDSGGTIRRLLVG